MDDYDDKPSFKELKQFDLAAACSGSEEESDAELQGVWNNVPEEVLWNILMRLPVATQCRFRSVCSRWKDLLSGNSLGQDVVQVESRPLCTIMANGEYTECRFFSHIEKKWYRLPFQPESCLDFELDNHWYLHATDGGLLYYENCVFGVVWRLVCNPMNGSFQIVPPSGLSVEMFNVTAYAIDFSVDLKTKTFRIVTVHSKGTAIFYSNTQEWKVFEKQPDSARCSSNFVWKNMIYSPTEEPTNFLAFDMEVGLWSTVEADIPLECRGKYYSFITSKDQVMLLSFDEQHEDPIQIWMSMDRKDAPTLSLSKWQKEAVEIPVYIRPLIKYIRNWWAHGNEYICFSTRSIYNWLKYTFKTKTWCVMPPRGRRRPPPDFFCDADPNMLDSEAYVYSWFNWEPRIDIHVEPFRGNFDDYLELSDVEAWEMQVY